MGRPVGVFVEGVRMSSQVTTSSLISQPSKLTEDEFLRVSEMVHTTCGIFLKDGKQDLVKARLGRRLRTLGLVTFTDYFDYVESDRSGAEMAEMVDLITTNKTQFFRDADHFALLRERIKNGWLSNERRIRFWCAGCSMGQEPYTLAMVFQESLPGIERRDLKILATDICRPALEKASSGRYSETEVVDVADSLLDRYFIRLPVTEGGGYEAISKMRNLLYFARLNLMEDWPIKGPFHGIMCRNVMIYFDRPTRERLVNRFWNLLGQGGYLFVGFSESLTGINHQFKYVQPAVYMKG